MLLHASPNHELKYAWFQGRLSTKHTRWNHTLDNRSHGRATGHRQCVASRAHETLARVLATCTSMKATLLRSRRIYIEKGARAIKFSYFCLILAQEPAGRSFSLKDDVLDCRPTRAAPPPSWKVGIQPAAKTHSGDSLHGAAGGALSTLLLGGSARHCFALETCHQGRRACRPPPASARHELGPHLSLPAFKSGRH